MEGHGPFALSMMTSRSASRWFARSLLAAILVLPSLSALAAREAKSLPPGAKPPQATRMPAPVYPEAMREFGLEGRVTVGFNITTEGLVDDPIIVRSNNPWFERPAIDAILGWRFRPAEVDGKKVNTRASQELVFSMSAIGRGGQGLWEVNRGWGKDGGGLPEDFQWHKAPESVSTAFPVYPFEALQANQQGVVRVGFIVDPRGKVVASKILEQPSPELGLAVLATIDTWAFTPPEKKDGTPCFAGISMKFDFQTKRGRGDVPVNFQMRDILKQLKEKPDTIYSPGQLDAVPKPISRRPPVYPTALLAQNLPGQASVEFFVDRNGDVQLPRIVSCSAPEFGYAAVQAIATWRYTVPRKGGKPVTARATIPLEFSVKPPAAEKK